MADARPQGAVGLSAPAIFRAPPALRPGDTVAVVAPAGHFDRESFDRGIAAIGARYAVRYEPGIFAQHRYLAGDDGRRLGELCRAMHDPGVNAIFCARGGYGSLRLLQHLEMPTAPKALVGFSDITAVHQWYQSRGLVSIHGPVLTQLGRQDAGAHARLFTLLESGSSVPLLHGTTTLVEGAAEGPLIGGNLSVFTRLLGTPFMPALTGAVLLLEDVGERPYRLDRMWTHLQLAGVFSQVTGIVLGSFTSCEERDGAYTSTEVLAELARATGLPCAGGFPIGHGDSNEPVALGTRVRLDAGARTLHFLEPATAQPRLA